MVKIPLSVDEIDNLLAWRDKNKDLVRACKVPFPDCEIVCNSGMKIRVKKQHERFFNCYQFTAVDFIHHEIKGRFMLNVDLNTVQQDQPALNHEQTQDCLTVWASAMAYIVNYQPEEIERPEKPAHEQKSKSKHKNVNTDKPRTIYLKRFVYEEGNVSTEHKRAYTKPTTAFTVRGHYRHYKSGKVVYIQPFTKNADQQQDNMSRILKMKVEV